MAITRLNNNSITSITALPSAIELGENTPNFSAFINGNINVSNNTLTKMPMSGEEFDSDNAFDSTTNYRFTVPTGKGGKYLIGGQIEIGSLSDANRIEIKIYKNGSEDQRARNFKYAPKNVGREVFIQTKALINLSAGDYVELYSLHSSSNSTETYYGQHSRFYGFKII